MRTAYVVCYDISDPKRLAAVGRTLKDFGSRLQFSVYHCELAPVDLARLRETLNGIIDHGEDKVLFVRLGPVEKSGELHDRFEVLGQKPELPDAKKQIF